MVEVINNPSSSGDNSGTGMGIGIGITIVIIVLIVFLLFMFGWGGRQNDAINTPNAEPLPPEAGVDQNQGIDVEVPERIEIDVENP